MCRALAVESAEDPRSNNAAHRVVDRVAGERGGKEQSGSNRRTKRPRRADSAGRKEQGAARQKQSHDKPCLGEHNREENAVYPRAIRQYESEELAIGVKEK